jgi:hypothetical protein
VKAVNVALGQGKDYSEIESLIGRLYVRDIAPALSAIPFAQPVPDAPQQPQDAQVAQPSAVARSPRAPRQQPHYTRKVRPEFMARMAPSLIEASAKTYHDMMSKEGGLLANMAPSQARAQLDAKFDTAAGNYAPFVDPEEGVHLLGECSDDLLLLHYFYGRAAHAERLLRRRPQPDGAQLDRLKASEARYGVSDATVHSWAKRVRDNGTVGTLRPETRATLIEWLTTPFLSDFNVSAAKRLQASPSLNVPLYALLDRSAIRHLEEDDNV